MIGLHDCYVYFCFCLMMGSGCFAFMRLRWYLKISISFHLWLRSMKKMVLDKDFLATEVELTFVGNDYGLVINGFYHGWKVVVCGKEKYVLLLLLSKKSVVHYYSKLFIYSYFSLHNFSLFYIYLSLRFYMAVICNDHEALRTLINSDLLTSER